MSDSFTLCETSFYTWGVTRGIVGVLEGLTVFIVGFDVKDRFCFQSHSYVREKIHITGAQSQRHVGKSKQAILI